MRTKLLLVILCLFAFSGVSHAQCGATTPAIGMCEPTIGSTTGWGTAINNDLVSIDQLLGGAQTLTVNSTTPSVASFDTWVTANTASTAITNFTGGFSGQTIHVICGDTNTSLVNGSTLVLATSFSCATPTAITLTLVGSAWHETGRGGGSSSGGVPGGSTNDVQTNNGSGGFQSGVTNTANVGKVGNIFLKPQGAVQYVASYGNDSNDGMSWGSARLTVYKAIESLPGGSTSPPTAGTGTIEVDGTVNYGGPVTNQGLWLIGNQDPNFSSPPTGFLIEPNGNNSLTLHCAFPNGYITQSHIPACIETTWGSTTTAGIPPYWFAGTGGTKNILYFDFETPITGGRIGISSSGARTGSGAQQINLIVGQNINQVLGCGPGLDMGDNVFWIWVYGGFQGCKSEKFAISSLSRSGNVVTAVTSATNDFAVGNDITVIGASDPSFNSLLSGGGGGTYTVASVSGSPQTTITWNQIGPNTSGVTGAYVFGDKAAAININGVGGMGGDAQIHLTDINAQYDGAIRISGSSNYTSVTVDKDTMEGSGTTDGSTVIVTGSLAAGFVHVNAIEPADITGGPGCSVEDDYANTPDSIKIDSSWAACGPATISGGYAQQLQAQTVSPYRQGQTGFINGYAYGQTDISRRQFGPVAVQTVNLAHSPSAYNFLGNASITLGQTALDGTSGAALLNGTATGGGTVYVMFNSTTLNVGDSYVFGAWTRATTSAGYSQSSPITFTLNGGGAGAGDTCAGAPPTGSISTKAPYLGDTQWEWTYGVCKIATNPTTAGVALTSVILDTTHPMLIYAPIVLKLPSGSYSQNEVWNIAANLQSYDPNCAAGTICGIVGQKHVADSFGTLTNCSSSASPAVCASASSGNVLVAASATTVVVDTTQVTANSQILLTFDSSLGTKLGVTCNTTPVQGTVSARTAGTSFTITVPSAPTTNPACFSYSIVN